MDQIKEHFNKRSKKFDNEILKIFPKYNTMLTALINAIPNTKNNPKIIDLGCGTGNITLKILEKFPNAEITCLDLSEDMIQIAKEKLKKYPNITYITADFAEYLFNKKYDAIISSLALHHIVTSTQKQEMYNKIYEQLTYDGVFYNADIIKAPNNYNQALYKKVSKEEKDPNLSKEKLDEYEKNRTDNDHPETIFNHIKWLEKSGFKEIDVIWKYYDSAVYGGIKKE
ncbi:MAG: methyltransferase domain-containing protein [Methanobacteriaceae archaeon]|nr:methyltransferase domain-containing protein [Methanobacteriaceae archaeon]